jgi:hypothetical protein
METGRGTWGGRPELADPRTMNHRADIVLSRSYSAFGGRLAVQRPANAVTLCDDHWTIFVATNGQILK